MPALFNPTLASQRYSYVESFLMQRPEIATITDIGCGNGRMLNWIKTVPTVERVNCLDSDYMLLDDQLDRYLRPNLIEAVFGRKNSDKDLTIRVFHGDAAVPHDPLKADCFSLVEMIEHITLQEVETISRTIFCYYQPKHVIVTTPNSEFNHLLDQHDSEGDPNKPKDPNNKFRHFDHKFEWTRAEFNQWAQYVCNKYNYEYYMDGVGHLPGSEPYGPCTQIAIFKRKSETPTPPEQVDMSCFDLLLNKLTFAECYLDCVGDIAKQRVIMMGEYMVPGSKNVAPGWVDTDPPISWGDFDKIDQSTSQGEQTSQELEDDGVKCDKEDCYCHNRSTISVTPVPVESYWTVHQTDDSAMDQSEEIDLQANNPDIVWW